MNTTIALTGGLVDAAREDEVVVARNVPYATAARFEDPRPHPGWAGVRDGSLRGPACPQMPSRLDRVTGLVIEELAQDERCHVLSVAAPAGAEGRDLPVLVWFHGGAYLSGGGEAPKYDPVRLAAEGQMVVVTVTYRLGIFGYMAPSDTGASNLGLQDQAEALRWVRREIAAFGGDPEQVTVAGQSAGADSVYCLLLMHPAEPLFQRAILSSTPLGLRDGRQPMTEALQAIVDAELGDRLDASPEQVLATQARLTEAASAFGLVSGFPLAPITGTGPLPSDDHRDAVLAATAPRVDLMIGYTRHDASAFILPDSGQTLDDPAIAELVQTVTDGVFAGPSRAFADSWRAAGGQATTFVFDGAPATAPFGATHCIELPAIFGTDWSDAPMLGVRPGHHVQASQIRDAWLRFARNGASGFQNEATFAS